MTAACVRMASGLLALLLLVIGPPAAASGAAAPLRCRGGVEVDLAGSGDVAVVSGRSAATCQAPPPSPRAVRAPYTSDELLCSPEQARAPAGRCSATPCRASGLFLAVRTLHDPGGRERMAGFACMELRRARVGPGIAAARVLEAVRAVKLPGGTIRVTPDGRGLANLTAYFRLTGVAQRAVDLPLGGSVIHAEFQVVGYRWAFGDGSVQTGTPTALADSAGEAHAYSHSGRFEIRADVAWSAVASLDGRRVGRIDDLASHALISYPVAEIRTTLSG